MTQWPEPESRPKIPEGHYTFRLNREPELIGFTYKDREGVEKKGRKIKIYAAGIGAGGEYLVIDTIVAWDERYRDLCEALGVEHGKDIQVVGSYFEADIKHELDKNDPTKSYPRFVNITKRGDVPNIGPEPTGGDDIPF